MGLFYCPRLAFNQKWNYHVLIETHNGELKMDEFLSELLSGVPDEPQKGGSEHAECEIKVVDVFHQAADCGIPAHWCCQFINNGWADYVHFATAEEAYEFARNNGWEG